MFEALRGGLQNTKHYRDGWDRKVQHEADAKSMFTLERSFIGYGDDLERVEDENDTQVMRSNLKKV